MTRTKVNVNDTRLSVLQIGLTVYTDTRVDHLKLGFNRNIDLMKLPRNSSNIQAGSAKHGLRKTTQLSPETDNFPRSNTFTS